MPKGVLDAVMASFWMRLEARSYRKKIEKDAGAQSTALQRLTSPGIVISLLAFASFCYLWGLGFAVTIAVVILLHELGHALAMKLVGMEVKGIYLIPFFGGLAVPEDSVSTDFQAGFVCLMGPGFSLVPTFAFLGAYQLFGGSILHQAVQVSAIINLLNLLPILPLDGGHVIKSILTAVNRRLANIAAAVGLVAGIFLAWRFETYVLGALMLLVAGGLLFPGQGQGPERARAGADVGPGRRGAVPRLAGHRRGPRLRRLFHLLCRQARAARNRSRGGPRCPRRGAGTGAQRRCIGLSQEGFGIGLSDLMPPALGHFVPPSRIGKNGARAAESGQDR